MNGIEKVLWPIVGVVGGYLLFESIPENRASAAQEPVAVQEGCEASDALDAERLRLENTLTDIRARTQTRLNDDQAEVGEPIPWSVGQEDTHEALQQDVATICEQAPQKTVLVDMNCEERPCLALIGSPVTRQQDAADGLEVARNTLMQERPNTFSPQVRWWQPDGAKPMGTGVALAAIALPEQALSDAEQARVRWRMQQLISQRREQWMALHP